MKHQVTTPSRFLTMKAKWLSKTGSERESEKMFTAIQQGCCSHKIHWIILTPNSVTDFLMSSLSIRAGQKRLSVFFPPAIPPISLVFCVIASLRLQNLFSETHREMKWQNYEIDQIHSQPFFIRPCRIHYKSIGILVATSFHCFNNNYYYIYMCERPKCKWHYFQPVFISFGWRFNSG